MNYLTQIVFSVHFLGSTIDEGPAKKILVVIKLYFSGSHDVRLRVHLRIPFALRNGTSGARVDQDEHGHTNHCCQPTRLPQAQSRR